MTEYPYDENPDPNAPNQRAESLCSDLQDAMDEAIAAANDEDHAATLCAIRNANLVLWTLKDRIAAELGKAQPETDGPSV